MCCFTQCGYIPHLKLHLLNYEVACFIKLEEESRWNRFPGSRFIFTSLMLLILCSSRSCSFRRQAQPCLQLTGRSQALHVVNSPAVEPGSLMHLISVYTAAPQSRKTSQKAELRVCVCIWCVWLGFYAAFREQITVHTPVRAYWISLPQIFVKALEEVWKYENLSFN